MCTHETSDISNILLHVYNFEVSKLTRLTGYDDINYAVEARCLGTEDCGKFVLKIVNATDSATQYLTEAIMAVLQSISIPELSTSKPINSKNGKLVEYTSITGTSRKIVLLTYVDGLCHKEIRLSQDNFLDLCCSIGSCAGTLARELNRLTSLIRPLPERPGDIYMIENLHHSRSKLHVIANETVKQISLEIMSIIEDMPKSQPLRKSVIHNDLCLENIIFSCERDGKYAVQGVIDFSDMTFGYLVFDVAIPIASCMYQTYFLHESSDFLAARLVFQEFERLFPLNLIEKDFLFYAVLARFISLRVVGGYDVLHSLETAQHEEHDSKPLEHFIQRLWAAGKSEFDEKVLY